MHIREITEQDLVLLERIRGEKLEKLHLKRIRLARESKAQYIIAIDNEEPVGHVMINFSPEYEWQTTPVVEDLFVRKERRKKGIGTYLMDYVEKIASEKYNTICLDAEKDDKKTQEFYEKRGYKIVSGPHILEWIGEQGQVCSDIVVHLQKKFKKPKQ